MTKVAGIVPVYGNKPVDWQTHIGRLAELDSIRRAFDDAENATDVKAADGRLKCLRLANEMCRAELEAEEVASLRQSIDELKAQMSARGEGGDTEPVKAQDIAVS